MNQSIRTGMVLAALVLAASVGCSKSEAPDSKSEATVTRVDGTAMTDVAGLAQETLLVLKFHHDN